MSDDFVGILVVLDSAISAMPDFWFSLATSKCLISSMLLFLPWPSPAHTEEEERYNTGEEWAVFLPW